jgi:glyoxylate/hydroxypyruvate reductase A
MGAGADGVVSVSQLPGGIPIVRVNDAGMAVQMAEYVCHALIRHARGFDAYDRQAADRLWQPRPELDRSAWPVGVMGLGSIGARVAQSVAGFDYPVFGWARTPKHLPAIKSFAGPGQFDEFLCSVRVLVCVLPLTHETRGILDRRTLLKLRPGGYLINVARGGHLVEADLLELLDSGRLAGACLDVAADEPLGDGHPFWRNPKITLTPHISAITRLAESAAQIARKIHALERGEPVAGVVARDHGY